MTNIIKILNGLEFLYPENITISQIKRTFNLYPEVEDSIIDAYSIGQLKSKLWLIENLPNNLGLVFICAGWYGVLANLMFQKSREKFLKIRSFDIDPKCAEIADNINRSFVMDGWQFKASTFDIKDMKYPLSYITCRRDKSTIQLTETPNTIINTSCEHIGDFSSWYSNIPQGTLCVLQTNNFFEIDDHINCSESLESFADITPMTEVVFEGELDCDKYMRFMRIGYR